MTIPSSPSPRGLRFGFSTLGCPELDAAGVRTLAARFESAYVEIRTLGGSLDFVAALAGYPGGAPAVRDCFLEANVRTCVVGSSFQLTQSPREQRMRLIAEAEAGEALGARWLRVFGGGAWGDPLTAPMATVARDHRAWWQAVRAARGWNIDLIVEVHDAFSGSPQLLALLDQSGGPMPILWDTHHTWKIGGEEAARSWELLGPQVRHVHVKDSVVTTEKPSGYEYVSPGEGQFPLADVLGLLQEAGYGGVVSLEWERQWMPALAPLESILPAWNRAIRPFRRPAPLPDARAGAVLLLKCDCDHARIVPATGPYFHGGREQYEDVAGASPASCPPGLGEPTADYPRLGKLRIYYEGGTEGQRSARIVPDEDDPGRRVLRFRLDEPNVVIHWPDGTRQRKSRVQAEVYGNIEWRDFYQTVRLRLRPEAAKLRDFPGPIHWFTLMEFWNNAGWTDEPYVFRFGLHLAKPDPAPGTDLFFATGSQTFSAETSFVDVWHETNAAAPVAFGEWMQLEVYFREGDARTGRFYAAVTPAGGARRVLFDVRGCTHHPENPFPTGLKQACPLKLYTSDAVVDYLRAQGVPLEVDWADLELWRGRLPPEDAERSRV